MLKCVGHHFFVGITFVIFTGSATAKEEGPEHFSGRQLLDDLDELQALITDLHPNPHQFLPKEVYDQKIKEARAALQGGGTKIDFYTAVAPLVADIKDDHTLLFPPPTPVNILPFTIFSITEPAVVPVSPTAINYFPRQGRLIRINDTPWSTIQKDTLSTIGGTESVYREKRFSEQPHRFLNAQSNWGESVELLFCVPTPLFEIDEDPTYASGEEPCVYDGELNVSGYLHRLQLPTISKSNVVQWIPHLQTHVVKLASPLLRSQVNMPEDADFMVVTSKHPSLRPGDVLLRLNGEPFQNAERHVANNGSADLLILRNDEELRFLLPLKFPSKNLGFHYMALNDSVMLLRIEQFQNQEVFKARLDKMFQEMRDKKLDQLIVDIRKSEGGNPALIRTFFSYVSEQKMSPHQAVVTKRNQHLKSEKPILYHTLPMIFWWREGPNTYRIPSVEKPPFKRDAVFEGDIIVLTNRSTFSTAASFAAVLSDYDRALVIGETTGSLASRMGNPLGFQLNETNVQGLISKSYYVRPSGEESESGVVPNRHEASERSLDFALEVMALKKMD